MNRSSTRTPSEERPSRGSPHVGKEAKEREAYIRWRRGDPEILSPPSYVPSPQGNFFSSHSPSFKDRSARQAKLAKARSRSRSPNSSSPLQSQQLKSQSPAPPLPPTLPPPQSSNRRAGTSPPTRTVSPSKRQHPIHCVTPPGMRTGSPKEGSPGRRSSPRRTGSPGRVGSPSRSGSPGVKFSEDTEFAAFAPPGSPTGSHARDVQYEEIYQSHTNINDCRHLIGRGTQQDRQAAQWAHSLRGAAASPFLSTKMHTHPMSEVREGSSRERSIASQVRSLSTHAYLTLGQGGKPLRVTVSGKDKWTTVEPQQWVVPPLERLSTFCKRCGLAEPAAPKIDKSFNGYVVTNVTKSKSWHSATDPNTSMTAFGVESGDELTVTTVWATYRTRP